MLLLLVDAIAINRCRIIPISRFHVDKCRSLSRTDMNSNIAIYWGKVVHAHASTANQDFNLSEHGAKLTVNLNSLSYS